MISVCPRRRQKKRQKKAEPIHLYFSVDDWNYHYAVMAHREWWEKKRGPGQELHGVEIKGTLISKPTKKIERAEIRLYPDGKPPHEWHEGKELVGAVTQIRDGCADAFVSVPPLAFSSMLVTLSCGRLREVHLGITELRRGSGDIYTAWFTTEATDPEELAEM